MKLYKSTGVTRRRVKLVESSLTWSIGVRLSPETNIHITVGNHSLQLSVGEAETVLLFLSKDLNDLMKKTVVMQLPEEQPMESAYE